MAEAPPRKPSALGLGGRELDAVFAKAMARDPGRRYASAREQVEAIVRALAAHAPPPGLLWDVGTGHGAIAAQSSCSAPP